MLVVLVVIVCLHMLKILKIDQFRVEVGRRPFGSVDAE